MEDSYHIWDIDEMPEEELQKLFPSEKSGIEHKTEVLQFLGSNNLLATKLYNFERFLSDYRNSDKSLAELLYKSQPGIFNLYTARLTDSQLLENLHNVEYLVFEAAERVWESKIPLEVILSYDPPPQDKIGTTTPEYKKNFIRYYMIKFLMKKELTDREGRFGSYFDLVRISLKYVNRLPDVTDILLLHGTDEERNTENFQEKDIIVLGNILITGLMVEFRDAVRYLYTIGVNLNDMILGFDRNYYMTKNMKTKAHIIITYILDFICYDEELIRQLTNTEIIEVINNYYSQI